MTTLSIQPPFPLLTDIDGQPLEDGYIWIGVANLPPIGNPIAVYWDAALTQPAALPIRTRGGYPVNAGTPARLYVGSDYSILVQNKNGSALYSAPAATERYSDPVITGVSSAEVSFLQAGLGAVVRTAQSKMRDVVSVKDFGAVGDGVTNDTDAFAAASAAITAAGGGKLIIPPGTYIVGKQTLAGATGLGYAYLAADIIKIENCTRPVVIEGSGAILKVASGLKFGSFNPTTGASFTPGTLPFTDADYRAIIGRVISLSGNQSVVVRSLEIDGNQSAALLGGQWGDTGRQIESYGIWTRDNTSTTIEDVYSHHNCLDGIACGETAASADDAKKPVTLINCIATYNARNNMTWFGGLGLTAVNCKFNYAGRGTFSSAPAAGFDPEPDVGVCRNGLFINCEFSANGGLGFGADSGDTADFNFIGCKFLGTVTYPIKPNKPRIKFIECTIGGCAFGAYNAPNFIDAVRFTQCAFQDNLQIDGVTANFDSWLFEFAGQRVVFDDCAFTATSKLMGSSSLAQFTNCTGVQNGSAGAATIRGVFMGGNSFTFTTGSNDYSGSTYYGVNEHSGSVGGANIYNGKHTATSPQFRLIQAFGNDGATGVIVTQEWSYQAPISGTYVRGSVVWNQQAALGQPIGWLCTVSGSPGTWVAMANL